MRVLSTRTLDEFGKSAAFSVAMWRVSTQPRPKAVLARSRKRSFVTEARMCPKMADPARGMQPCVPAFAVSLATAGRHSLSPTVAPEVTAIGKSAMLLAACFLWLCYGIKHDAAWAVVAQHDGNAKAATGESRNASSIGDGDFGLGRPWPEKAELTSPTLHGVAAFAGVSVQPARLSIADLL
jgi:hypothetical protein